MQSNETNNAPEVKTMDKQLKAGLSLHTHIDWRSGETVYTICDSVGAVYSTIFPARLERFYEVAA